MAIPLPSQSMEDFVAWSLTKTGTFSVRSVYFAECESQFGHKVSGEPRVWTYEGSPNVGDNNLEIDSKVKIYMADYARNTTMSGRASK